MLLKINGVPFKNFAEEAPVFPVLESEIKAKELVKKVGKFTVPASISLGIMNLKSAALAAIQNPTLPVTNTDMSEGLIRGIWPLIDMLQAFAFPVGVGVAIWGIIEVIATGSPAGFKKIKYAVIGYIGVFLIPFAFNQIRIAFSAMGH